MAEFIQGVVLSDFMIFTVMGLAGLAITVWAFSRQEYAGYALGWLISLFLIILFSTLVPVAPDANLGSFEQPVSSMSFLAAFIPGMLGLFVGFGIITGVRMSQSRGKARAITIAILLTLVLVSGYLMILTTFTFRLAIAVFVIAIAISIVFHNIMFRQQMVRADAEVVDADVVDEMGMMASEADEFANPTMNRVQRIRRRFQADRMRDL